MKIGTIKPIDQIIIELRREDVERAIRDSAERELASSPSGQGKKWRFVAAASDEYGGYKVVFIEKE